MIIKRESIFKDSSICLYTLISQGKTFQFEFKNGKLKKFPKNIDELGVKIFFSAKNLENICFDDASQQDCDVYLPAFSFSKKIDEIKDDYFFVKNAKKKIIHFAEPGMGDFEFRIDFKKSSAFTYKTNDEKSKILVLRKILEISKPEIFEDHLFFKDISELDAPEIVCLFLARSINSDHLNWFLNFEKYPQMPALKRLCQHLGVRPRGELAKIKQKNLTVISWKKFRAVVVKHMDLTWLEIINEKSEVIPKHLLFLMTKDI